MVNTVDQAEAVGGACRYAPVGARSLGPIGAGARYGPKYISGANENIAVIPMIETVEAVANVGKIAATPGVDALFIGPADLSMTLGLPPAMDHDDDQFNDALQLSVVAASSSRPASCPPSTQTRHSSPNDLHQGFRMITIGYDLQPMLAGLHRPSATAATRPMSSVEPRCVNP